MLHAVVMAGGSGTRFWPQSRKRLPKQLLKLAGDQTMIQQTVGRCDGWIDQMQTWVVTNEIQAAETARQLPNVPQANILIEPCGRNTAPCIGLAAVHITKNDPDGIMFVMPADHVIGPQDVFQSAGRVAEQLIAEDPNRFVLFGVPPTFPSTGYGYIERGGGIKVDGGNAFEVASFREKPAREVAQKYMDAGSYYWNCGIFCWRAQSILDALKEHEPNTFARLMTIGESIGGDYDAVLAEQFPQTDSISIDYAVLERAKTVSVVEAPYEWDDVGSWLALPRLMGTDDSGNTIDGSFCGVETKNCIVRTTDDGHTIATLGVEDLIIVHTDDATLVANRNDADSIRKLVDALKESGNDKLL